MSTPHLHDNGITQEVPGERLKAAGVRFEEVLRVAALSGDHVWTAIVQHHIIDPVRFVDGGHLDAESVVAVHLGCYICEQPYDPLLVRRRCPGEPR